MTLGFENIGPLWTAIIYIPAMIAIQVLTGCAIGATVGHYRGKGETKGYVKLFAKIFAVLGTEIAIVTFLSVGANSNWFR